MSWGHLFREKIEERNKFVIALGCVYWLGATLALGACVAGVAFFTTDFRILILAAVIFGFSLLVGTLASVAQMAFDRFVLFLALSGKLDDLDTD